jgi:hypothetical protein
LRIYIRYERYTSSDGQWYLFCYAIEMRGKGEVMLTDPEGEFWWRKNFEEEIER